MSRMRETAAWTVIGALLCIVGCSRTSQPVLSQSGTPQGLEAIVRDFADQHRLPGLAAGVWLRGEVVLRMGLGNQDGPGSRPIDGETVFHLASVTKPFVATAVMQLVAEGKMCLDCPLQRYLPYFSMQGPGVDRITIRQLLTHTAGMGDTSDFGWTTPEYDDGAVERYVRSLASVRLDFEPGSEWRYSNRGFDVLADAIAKADGQPFETVIQRRILTPLGMRRSTLLMSDLDSARLARVTGAMGPRSATILTIGATLGVPRSTPLSMTCCDGRPPTWDAAPSASSEFCPRPHTMSSGTRTGTSVRPSPSRRAGRATSSLTTAWPSGLVGSFRYRGAANSSITAAAIPDSRVTSSFLLPNRSGSWC